MPGWDLDWLASAPVRATAVPGCRLPAAPRLPALTVAAGLAAKDRRTVAEHKRLLYRPAIEGLHGYLSRAANKRPFPEKCFNTSMGRATIRQIAAEAGVSIATVSRVANGHADVSSQTRRTVERVIRERGYRATPRSRQGLTGLIGVAVPLVQHSYFAGILAGATEALYEHGMHVVLCPTAHSHQRELSLVERLAAGDSDGAILVMPEESGEELQALVGQGFPVVIIDPRVDLPDGIPVVCAAHSSGAVQATQHLVELGHQRIGAISGPPGWMATQERLRGYYAALASAGMLPDPRLVVPSDWTPDGGRAAAMSLARLDAPPTAIFAFNDGMAAGAVQAAAALGMRVPDDISVVGFDDTIEAQVAVPALTTVRQPLAELGRTAVSLLLRQLENFRLEPLRVELETRLTKRQSTGDAPLQAGGRATAARPRAVQRGTQAAS